MQASTCGGIVTEMEMRVSVCFHATVMRPRIELYSALTNDRPCGIHGRMSTLEKPAPVGTMPASEWNIHVQTLPNIGWLRLPPPRQISQRVVAPLAIMWPKEGKSCCVMIRRASSMCPCSVSAASNSGVPNIPYRDGARCVRHSRRCSRRPASAVPREQDRT